MPVLIHLSPTKKFGLNVLLSMQSSAQLSRVGVKSFCNNISIQVTTHTHEIFGRHLFNKLVWFVQKSATLINPCLIYMSEYNLHHFLSALSVSWEYSKASTYSRRVPIPESDF